MPRTAPEGFGYYLSGMMHPLRAHIEEISPLTDTEWEFVSKRITSKKCRKHQYLVQQGDPVPGDFWVAKGLLKAYAVDEGGKEHILQFAMAGWWCSDYQALQTGRKASIFIDCLEASEVYCLKRKDREEICSRIHAMERFFRIKSNTGYIALQKRIISLLKESTEERYANLVKQYPTLAQRVPKKLLAAYLGVTRETLSRLHA
jgi:CRP/FNR family transcriptional regulator